MRILVLSHLFPPHAVGGYELSCGDVVRRWRDAGHDVQVLASRDRLAGVADVDPPWVHRVLTTFHAGAPGAAHPRGRLAMERALAADHWQTRRLLRSLRPDVVSVWHPGGAAISIVGRLLDSPAPTVFVGCDPWPVYKAKADPTWHRRRGLFVGAVNLDVGHWVCCSAALAATLATEAGVHADEIVPLGVDLETFPPSRSEPAPWTGRLLFVGRLVEDKGVLTAVEALARLPSAHLELLGHGRPTDRETIIELATSLGVRDRLTIDAVPRQQLRERYQNADAVLFPSQWEEPFGIVPLEAMACATPVVATGTGGSGEFLQDEVNCLLAPPGDAAGLAAAVNRLASDPELRQRLVAGGLDTASGLSTDRLAATLEAIHLRAAA